MEKLIASAQKEVLIEMVKLAQKRGMAGSNGKWKEFLKFYDKKFGASLSDPSRRSIDSLVAFLKTFTQYDDLQVVLSSFSRRYCNRNEVQEFKKISPDKETSEQRLVRLTLEHPHYPVDYSFPSHEEDWLIIKRSKKSKAMKSTEMIAIDCEMVLCKDGTEALVKVKLDEVVNPDKEIADYRTQITGISATDLDGVTHSLKDVQAMLGYELRVQGNPHNCLDDACAAMKLVLARLEGRIDDVTEVKEPDTGKLLIHRIPANVPIQDLKGILTGDFTTQVKDICGRSQKLVKFELDSGLAGTVCICKAFSEDYVGQSTKKRSTEDEDDTAGVCKKLRTDQTSELLEDSNPCKTHLKQIERLKGELRQRDEEISNLNKIIAALTRKQGL